MWGGSKGRNVRVRGAAGGVGEGGCVIEMVVGMVFEVGVVV